MLLWEQVESSVEDDVVLLRIHRGVGFTLVDSCKQVYDEYRALQSIHEEYATGTESLVTRRMPMATSSTPARLVLLEVEGLVALLRQRAADAGASDDALLPVDALQIDAILGNSSNSPERTRSSLLISEAPGTSPDPVSTPPLRRSFPIAPPERLSLRKLSQLSSSSKSSATAPSSPSTSASSCCVSPREPPPSPRGPHAPLHTVARSRPPSARLCLSSNASNDMSSPKAFGDSRPSTSGTSHAFGDSRPASGKPHASRGTLVLSRLRSALEEEKDALLAHIAALRLAIDDEHDYRERVVTQPTPSLPSLIELKRILQKALSQTEAMAALNPAVTAGTRAGLRGELSRHGPPLPPSRGDGDLWAPD